MFILKTMHPQAHELMSQNDDKQNMSWSPSVSAALQALGMNGLRMLFQASECPKNNCSVVLFLACSNLPTSCTIFIDGLVLFQTMGYRRNVNKKCFT